MKERGLWRSNDGTGYVFLGHGKSGRLPLGLEMEKSRWWYDAASSMERNMFGDENEAQMIFTQKKPAWQLAQRHLAGATARRKPVMENRNDEGEIEEWRIHVLWKEVELVI